MLPRVVLALTLAVAVAVTVAVPGLPALAETRQTAATPVEIDAVVTGLDAPWAVGFLPGGGLLITERDGRLLHVGRDGTRGEVAGVPEVRAAGQGGLLDLLVPTDFAERREIFLSFAKPQGGREGTAVARARLSDDAARLEDVTVIWEMAPGSSGGRHFGSRLVEGEGGTLFVTVGDRGDRPSAQDMRIESGSIVRIRRDGTIPADNPLVGRQGARQALWTWGHRNPQGMARDGQGRLWAVEHGARGGDEVNLIERATNYGWPIISYGRHYSGARIGEGTEKEGMAQPAHYWDPSIAPSGMAFVTGGPFAEFWGGDILVGSLNSGLISRLEVEDKGVREVERIATPETQRVRDIRLGPDGAIWFLSEGNGTLYRMAPAPGG